MWSPTRLHSEDLIIDLVNAAIKPAGGPGLVAGVAIGHNQAMCHAVGLASFEFKVPLSPKTRLRIGSVSKHFVCALALLLERDGAISLDDKVSRHLPEFGGKGDRGERVTVRHLCNNTSGVVDFLESLHLSGSGLMRPVSMSESTALVLGQSRLNCRPGERLIYSAGGFLALSVIIERITGRSLDRLLAERLFEPAGMTDSALIPSDKTIVANMAAPYVTRPDGTLGRGGWGLELSGEGGIVSTLDDMLGWGRWLLTDDIGRLLLDQMTAPSMYANGQSGIYGLGLCLTDYRGMRLVSHGGRTPGFGAQFILVPELGGVVVLIANVDCMDTYALGLRIINALVADVASPVPTEPTDWADRQGIYVDDDLTECLEIVLDAAGPAVVTSSARYPLDPLGGGCSRPATPIWDAVLKVTDDTNCVLLRESGRDVVLHRTRRRGTDSLVHEVIGTYCNDDLASRYSIADDMILRMQGPRGYQDYRLAPVCEDLLIAEPFGPFASFHRPRLRVERAADGTISGLSVFTERTKGLLFHRVEAAGP